MCVSVAASVTLYENERNHFHLRFRETLVLSKSNVTQPKGQRLSADGKLGREVACISDEPHLYKEVLESPCSLSSRSMLVVQSTCTRNGRALVALIIATLTEWLQYTRRALAVRSPFCAINHSATTATSILV